MDKYIKKAVRSLLSSKSKRTVNCRSRAVSTNYPAYEVCLGRMSNLNDIMDALTDSDTNIIGVHGEDNDEKIMLLGKIRRRADRDKLFDVVVMANVKEKPDLRRIQGELAHELGIEIEVKSITERAGFLCDRMKIKQKVLVILQDVFKGIDLDKLGIPFGEDHRGCKILLTSPSEKILSNKMNAQKVFLASF